MSDSRGRVQTSGFSLIEVLIAFGILSVVIGGCFAAVMQGARMQSMSRMTTIGTQIMQNEIEDLRSLRWEQFIAEPAQQTLVIPPSFGELGARFSGSRSIVNVRSEETRKVMLEITWASDGGRTHTRKIWTYISKNGRAYVPEDSPYFDFTDDTADSW